VPSSVRQQLPCATTSRGWSSSAERSCNRWRRSCRTVFEQSRYPARRPSPRSSVSPPTSLNSSSNNFSLPIPANKQVAAGGEGLPAPDPNSSDASVPKLDVNSGVAVAMDAMGPVVGELHTPLRTRSRSPIPIRSSHWWALFLFFLNQLPLSPSKPFHPSLHHSMQKAQLHAAITNHDKLPCQPPNLKP
jgi:hypothetical protein